MADYIDRNILCQAYVHVDLAEDFETSVRKLEKRALPLVSERAKFFLYEEAVIELEPSEGSVKSRITVFGTIFLALQGIANYKDFREGVILLSSDVERIAEVAATETLFALRARNRDVVRVEIRTGVVGSLRRIIASLDRISERNGLDPAHVQAERLEAVREQIDVLFENIQNAQDIELVAKELYLLTEQLPKAPLPRPKERLPMALINTYKERRRALLSSIRARQT